MSNVLRSPLLVAGCVAVACSVLTAATAQTPSAQKPKIKTASAVPIQSVDGADNFHAYCAVCHGADAKGNGPAAPAMKVKVPDLTTFAARHDGKFNDVQVEQIITGVGKTPSPAPWCGRHAHLGRRVPERGQVKDYDARAQYRQVHPVDSGEVNHVMSE
jgi:mono/diheme cytochrome c family protein